MHQKAVITAIFQNIAQGQNDVGRNVSQVLPRLHDVQVKVGRNVEQGQNLIQHLPMLGGNADVNVKARCCQQGFHDGGHFDGLRARAKNDKYFQSNIPEIQEFCGELTFAMMADLSTEREYTYCLGLCIATWHSQAQPPAPFVGSRRVRLRHPIPLVICP